MFAFEHGIEHHNNVSFQTLTFRMLAYHILKYLLKCASAGAASAHFSEYLPTYGYKDI